MATAAKHAPARPKRRNNRQGAVLDAAAARFRQHGYAATSMRDIAADAGMLPGSLYYHYPAKNALLVAVHEEGVRRIAAAVDHALAGIPELEPWRRLEVALAAHMETLLGGGDYSLVVLRDLPADDSALRARLVRLRDGYEARFKALCRALPLTDPDAEPWLRMMILGAANWARVWYRPGGKAPAEVARQFISQLKGAPP